MVVARCLILCSKFTNNRLPTGLRPDPLRELTALDHGGKMGKKDGREKGTEGEGRESGRGGEEKGRERGTPWACDAETFRNFLIGGSTDNTARKHPCSVHFTRVY